MYLLVSLILQSFFKKILELIQSYEDKHHFRDQNGPFVLNENFLVQTTVITFIYLLALFIVHNLRKFLQRIQNYDDASFLDPKWSICPNNFFLGNYYYHSHLPISPFHYAKFKKNSSSWSRVMRMCNFGPKMAHLPKWEVFLLFMPIIC